MKVRQAYEGRVIGGSILRIEKRRVGLRVLPEEHETTGVTETAFDVPGVFPSAEAAIQAAVKAGQQKIDSGFENKPIVEYRQ